MFWNWPIKRDCREERKEWLDYVDSFMLEAKLPDKYYGNWTMLVEDWRMKNQEKYHTNRNCLTESDEQQEHEKDKRNKLIEEISQILRDQRVKAGGKKMPEHLEQETTIEQPVYRFDWWKGDGESDGGEANRKTTRRSGSGKGRGNGFLSLQGSPVDTPQPKTQDE